MSAVDIQLAVDLPDIPFDRGRRQHQPLGNLARWTTRRRSAAEYPVHAPVSGSASGCARARCRFGSAAAKGRGEAQRVGIALLRVLGGGGLQHFIDRRRQVRTARSDQRQRRVQVAADQFDRRRRIGIGLSR